MTEEQKYSFYLGQIKGILIRKEKRERKREQKERQDEYFRLRTEWRKVRRYFAKEVDFSMWRARLSEDYKGRFDTLKAQGRLNIIYGARCVLCDVDGIGHYIPDLDLAQADIWNNEPLKESWLSERGRANLHRIKSGF